MPFDADAAVSIALKHVAEEPPSPCASSTRPCRPSSTQSCAGRWRRTPSAARPTPTPSSPRSRTRASTCCERRGRRRRPRFVPVAEEEVVEEWVEEHPNRRRAWWIALACSCCWPLAGAGRLPAHAAGQGRPCPSVVGQSLTVAQTRLQNEGFKVDVIRRTSDQAKDDVIAQDPSPGNDADEGRDRHADRLRRPGRRRRCPTCAGQSQAARPRALKRAGFKVARAQAELRQREPRATRSRPRRRPGSRARQGPHREARHVSTRPGAGDDPRRRRRGPGDAARSDLANAGFQVTEGQHESDQTPGTVLSQSPSGGTQVARRARRSRSSWPRRSRSPSPT